MHLKNNTLLGHGDPFISASIQTEIKRPISLLTLIIIKTMKNTWISIIGTKKRKKRIILKESGK